MAPSQWLGLVKTNIIIFIIIDTNTPEHLLAGMDWLSVFVYQNELCDDGTMPNQKPHFLGA